MVNAVTLRSKQLENLTPRQRAFIENPIVLTDPVEAARQSGYGDSFLQKGGPEAMRRALMPLIANSDTARAIRQSVSPDDVRKEMTAAMFANILDYFEVVDTDGPDGAKLILKHNIKALPPEIQRNIKRLEFDTTVLPDGSAITTIAKIELYDRSWVLKEFIEIMRLREGGMPADDASELLRNMPEKDLREIEQIFARASERARDIRKDKNAIDAKN